ncbi:hypothetical protein SBA7_1750009 [Candidatus Sulfotelmatobacter sp. SbA7]|nr:hypothetical protein SBA7_1750009 [Candidatus Sulfotelmatobacter sp. SbA7]
MSTKDDTFVEYIVENTENGKLRWEPTAGDTFMAPLRGDHTVTIEFNPNGSDILSLRSRDGNVILNLFENQFPQMQGLFERARRNAYDVDKVIDEIISGPPLAPPSKKDPSAPIADEDIPF